MLFELLHHLKGEGGGYDENVFFFYADFIAASDFKTFMPENVN